MSNGVKQGGVLSPLLFNIYLDVLLARLKDSKVGCHFGNTYIGSLAYADDVVLLCPTLSALKDMLHICEEYSKDFNISFNACKSKLIVYGQNVFHTEVIFQGRPITQVQSEKHVGILIGTDPNIDNMTLSKARGELFARFNLLLRQFSMCSTNVLYKLFNTFCTSLYGSQLWDFENDALLESVFIAWRKCVRRIYNIPYNTHCNLLHLLCNDCSIKVKLHRRFLRFFISAYESENTIVALLFRHVYGSGSKICNSINSICYKYGLNRHSLSLRDLPCILDHSNESDIITADIISDFMD